MNEKLGLYGIPSFYPTPPEVTEQMLDKIKVHKNDHILEPSAGKGDMAKIIQKRFPDNPLWVIEKHIELAFSLICQGFRLLTDDFLKFNERFEVIVMNPPFMMNYQDIDHFRHAWDCLVPGGRIVSLMHEYSVYTPAVDPTHKAVQFSQWVTAMGISHEILPERSFAAARFKTNTSIALLWGTKP